ncbi:MAG: ribonuclease E [Alphaproteobacteria bacterium]|jgi:ribonuclease E
MSINKMLIDATHPEETRVVVLRENRVEEFDYESAARKLLRGSIYLAKITRVEPSLQASFVDYGGNRHGFLAFAEVHPDYYQIPHADKLALLEQESRDLASYDDDLDEDDDVAETAPVASDPDDAEPTVVEVNNQSAEPSADHDFEANAIDVTDLLPDTNEQSEPNDDIGERAVQTTSAAPLDAVASSADAISQDVEPSNEPAPFQSDSAAATTDDATDEDDEDTHEDDVVESLNDADDDDDDDVVEAIAGEDDVDNSDDGEGDADAAPAPRARQQRPRRRARQYKIQEVIKRRQIVLIQVVKEERGNKGAALTTYLSLAGRYTVLMPNTARGGGISRKITNVQDRKRLKAIAQELEVPEGMGLIIRTAGAARTKQEIKRDFEYLLRLWESVRSLTLESTAPSLVYEEGNLIKRSIRDLYTKEIDEVVVAGEHAHKEAKGFMRMLMPSHAKNVIKHEDSQSLFAKFRIEQQLNAMFSPNVQLKSGGYLVINQTEALVAIDVNSGKSTREFSIEETALNTNLEAAEELSRQLKLRDLAGLIVVDFIDMEEKRNNRAVERCLKDSLRADRARIQVGRISHFGLLEMSRQRLRTGVLEGSTTPCEHCQGSGIVRSIESVSLAVLRGLEDSLVAGKAASCVASCSADVALYLLNQKRTFIQELEARYGVVIHVRSSSKQQGANFIIEPLHDVVPERPRPILRDAVNIDTGFSSNRVADNDDDATAAAATTDETTTTEAKPRRRRRRRGRRDEPRNNETDRETTEEVELVDAQTSDDVAISDEAPTEVDENGDSDRPRRSRRRGRRGGRRHREQRAETDDVAAPGSEQPDLGVASIASDAQPADARPDEVTQQTVATAQDDSTVEQTVTATADAEQQSEPEQVAATPTQPTTPEPIVDRMEAIDPIPTTPVVADMEPDAVKESAIEAPPEPVNTREPTPAPNDGPTTNEEPTALVDVPDRSARSQPVASEPVIQRVVVRPGGQSGSDNEVASDTETSPAVALDAPKAPSRRGWWQRQFGG